MKITDEIIKEVYLEDDIQEKVEDIKEEMGYWFWLKEEFGKLYDGGGGKPHSMNTAVFSMEYLPRRHFNEMEKRIINLSTDFEFAYEGGYPEFSNNVKEQLKSPSTKIIEFGKGSYYLNIINQEVISANYIYDIVEKNTPSDLKSRSERVQEWLGKLKDAIGDDGLFRFLTGKVTKPKIG